MNYISIFLLFIWLLLVLHIYDIDRIGLCNAVPLKLKDATRLVKDTALLSRVISNYIPIKAHGGTFKCICPFHKDTNPSMAINDDKGLYHCFSCGAGGDVIKFIQEYESCTFDVAVQKSIILSGLDISVEGVGTPTKYDPETIKKIQQKTKIEAILKSAAIYYAQRIAKDNQAGPARRHLMGRKIRPEVAFRFQLGYAPPSYGPDSLISNLTAAGYSSQDLVMAGLAIDRTSDDMSASKTSTNSNFKKSPIYDRFRDRLMIPIRDVDGKVIGFGARVLQDGEAYKTNAEQAKLNPGQLTPGKVDYSKVPKYLNSPETAVFKKSNTLFGLDLAKRAIATEKIAILVEGYFDVISLHDVGVEYAVGVLGTAITKEHLDIVTRYNKNGIVCVLMDEDEAGQAAVERCCKQVLMTDSSDSNINKDYDVRIASFRDIVLSANDDDNKKSSAKIKDAADLCMIAGKENAPTAIKHLVSQAVGWKQWMVERIITQGGKGRIPLSQDNNNRNTIYETVDYLRSDTASLGKVVRELSEYISKLPIAADRTVITYFCAELIAGQNEAMRKQLESDIGTMASQIAMSSKNVGLKAKTIQPYMPSNLNVVNNNMKQVATKRSQIEVAPKVYQPIARPEAMKLNSTPVTNKEPPKLPQLNQIPVLSNINNTVKLETPNKPTQLQPPKPSTIPNIKVNINTSTTFSAMPSSYQAISTKINVSETISLSDFDFDFDDATIRDAVTLRPRKIYKNEDATLWKPSNFNDKVLSFDSKSEKGRLVDAEATLLMVYLHVPFLRSEIKAGLTNIVKLTQKLIPSESLPFGGLTSKLGQMSNLLLNKVMTNSIIDDESNTYDDLFKIHEWEESIHSQLWNKITSFDDNDNDNDSENALLNSLTNDLKASPKLSNIYQGDYINPLSNLSLGFLVKEVLRTITFAQARRNQIKLLNSVSKKADANDQSSETTINDDSDDKLRNYEKLTSYLSESISDDLSQMYQDALRKERLSIMPQQFQIAEDGIESKFDDIELYYWETVGDNDEIDDNSVVNNDNTVSKDTNKYDFTFDAGDESAILKEGEYSEEEIRLKELYATGLAAQKNGAVTFGLDDIYEDDYGREKKKRKKNENNDWFGTYSNKNNHVDGVIHKDSLVRGGRAEKFLADRSKKHPLSTPELEAADGWIDEGLQEYEGIQEK